MSRVLTHDQFIKIAKLHRKASELTTELNDLIRRASATAVYPDVSISCFWPGQGAPAIKVSFFKDSDSIQNEQTPNRCRKDQKPLHGKTSKEDDE